ncbi:MAG: hypothetical protein H6968_11595 [Chromatiaceae bacterium]|nr:hypothetical protein [Chromatiaceae bacterium]
MPKRAFMPPIRLWYFVLTVNMRRLYSTPLAALLIATAAIGLFFAGIAAAQQTIPGDLQDAFEYLSVEQYGDGSYVPANPLASGLQTTGQVAQSLVVVPAGAAALASARSYLAAQPLTTVEERARRLLAGASSPNSPDVEALLDAINADGGSGSEPEYGSNVLDTSLRLVALKSAGVPSGIVARDLVVPASGSELFTIDVPADGLQLDILIESISGSVDVRIGRGVPPTPADPFFPISGTGIISITPASGVLLVPGTTHYIQFTSSAGATVSFRVDYVATSHTTVPLTDALAYLQDARNPDGGWGFQPGDADSRLYFTYWASRALAGTADPSLFVLGREVVGGGFSDSGAANVFDTALALLTLSQNQKDPETIAPASIAFLESAQLANGSFADDPFRTALALDALFASRTPLAPHIASSGGAGAGADFVTEQSVVTISGLAPVGSAGISVNIPGAAVVFDAATGEFSITLALEEGLNSITVSATNLAGVSGPPTFLEVTRNSSLLGQDLMLNSGFNAVSLALAPANPLDARGLLELLGPDSVEVQRLDPVIGLFETLARDGSGGFIGTNFALGELDGFFVVTSTLANAHLAGSTPIATTVDLVKGINTLTVPSPPASLDSFALLAQIGDDTVVSAIQRFDPLTGAFQTAIYASGVPAGVNFPIEAGVAYLVSMHQDLSGFLLPVGLSVAIMSPADAAVVTSTPLTVTGTVSGVPPITVTVNGVAATVSGGEFSADIPLVSGLNLVTAEATDAGGGSIVDVISVTLQAVDYTLPVGGFVQDSRVISADAATIAQVASLQWSFVGLPPEITYNVVGVFIISATEVQIDFQIDIASEASTGIYQFQVVNQLLDGVGTPLGPLTGKVFDFSIEVTP